MVKKQTIAKKKKLNTQMLKLGNICAQPISKVVAAVLGTHKQGAKQVAMIIATMVAALLPSLLGIPVIERSPLRIVEKIANIDTPTSTMKKKKNPKNHSPPVILPK